MKTAKENIVNTYTGTLRQLNRIEIDSYLFLPPLNIPIQSYIDKILFLFGRVVEYVFGIYFRGMILGLLLADIWGAEAM